MKTAYFTFGQTHTHRCGNKTLDCDTVVKITNEDPRARMHELFGEKWSMEYNEPPRLRVEGGWFNEIVEVQ